MKALAKALLVMVSTLGVACGGHSFVGDLDGTSDGGGGSDGGGSDGGGSDGGGGAACPSSVPAQNAPCSPADLTCEYGSDSNVQCDTVARCQAGRWEVQYPVKGQSCPSPGIEKGCPSSFGAVPQGKECTSFGLQCGYPQGRCACTLAFGPPVPVDAGAGRWYCEAPQQGCPQPRPRIGSACSLSGAQYCDYGACTLPGGTSLSCVSGIWHESMSACPALAL